MSKTLEIIARYQGERVRWPISDPECEGDYTLIGTASVAKSSADDCRAAGVDPEDLLTIKGTANDEDIERGGTYRFFGTWATYHNRYHNKRETQFVFRSFVRHVPHDPEGVADYLASSGKGYGIGPRKAMDLVKVHGVDAVLRVCRENVGAVMECTKISIDNATMFAAKLQEQAATEHATLEVDRILNGRGFPRTTARKAIKVWGNRAAEVIAESPYILMQFRGVGFRLADRLWKELGKDPRAIERQTMCLWHAIASNNDGHTWFPVESAIREMSKVIGGEIDPRAAILSAKKIAESDPNAHGAIVTARTEELDGVLSDGGPCLWLAEGKNAAAEDSVAKNVAKAVLESMGGHYSRFEQTEHAEQVVLDFARCQRCHRPLTANAVYTLGGRPYGPTCVGYVDPDGQAELVSLAEWLASHPEIRRHVTESPAKLVRFKEISLWPEVSAIEGISDHQRAELSLALASRVGILGGSPGTGKAQPLDEPVLTPDGWKPMGEIRPGNLVIAGSGKAVFVKAVFPQGVKKVYRVEFSDGTWTRCCGEHLWTTQTRKDRQSAKPGTAKTTAEIGRTLDRGDGSPNHTIPMVLPVEFSKTSLPLDPYVVGVLIGDGCLSNRYSANFSNPESDIFRELVKRLPGTVSIRKIPGDGCDFAITKIPGEKTNVVCEQLRVIGLAGKRSFEKRIPPNYMVASVSQRVDLLNGILDTDGSTDGHNVEYSTTSKGLCDDVCELVWSLGGTVNVAERSTFFTYKGKRKPGRLSYRVMVKLPASVKPFRLRRKLEKYIPKTKYTPTRYIKSVTEDGEAECQCISVDSQDGLYVTRSYIVTHNTWTVAALIKTIHRSGLVSLDQIAIGAPTGKAAVRLTESLSSHGLSVTARTWHSLLGVGKKGDGEATEWSFRHSEKEPWPYRVIIGDETSMPPLSIMASIFKARAPGCHVLFVGDVYQLPPIGNGAPFRDMINAGLSYGELREIKRNSGGIVEACAAIRDGLPWVHEYTAPGKNLWITGDATPAAQKKRIVELIAESGVDPVWDCQVLTAVNQRSEVSRDVLNAMLQSVLNPSPEIPGSPFREGDKVVCLSNGWFTPSTGHPISDELQNDSGEIYVANGEVGRVESIEQHRFLIRLETPERFIVVPRGKREKEDESGSGTGCSWDLAYAMSVHKYQGSEQKVVIGVLDPYPGARMLCDREWLRTLISRARNFCYLVGRPALAEQMCRVSKMSKRKTFLADKIRRQLLELRSEGL